AGAGDGAGAVPGAAPGEQRALALDLLRGEQALIGERAHQHLQQALVLAQIMLQPRDAFFQRADMRRLGDAKEVVVVAALLADVLDHERMAGDVERGERDAADVLVEAVFQRADAGFHVVRGWSPLRGRRPRRPRGRAQHAVERGPAAAVQLDDAGLEPLGTPVLEVGLDRRHVALEVVHVAVRRVRRFRHRLPAPWAPLGPLTLSTDTLL